MQLEIKVNKKELFNKIDIENTSDKDVELTIKKFRLFEKLITRKLKFNRTKKIIYSLSIFVFVIIMGLLLFF